MSKLRSSSRWKLEKGSDEGIFHRGGKGSEKNQLYRHVEASIRQPYARFTDLHRERRGQK